MMLGTASRDGTVGAGFRDLASLLHPSAGLVEAYSVEPPSASTVGMWRVTIRLQCEHNEAAGPRLLQPCVTGAAAPTRSDALLRALGETIERMALHRGPGVTATASELGNRAFIGPGHELALSSLDPTTPTLWYPARHVRSESELLVPSGLVDYPDRGEAGFDPGPSGAAAGFGHEAALRSALLETIERDAVIVSWARRLHLRAIDFAESVGAAGSDGDWREVHQLLRIGAAAELTPLVAEVPVSVRDVRCVVGGFRADTPAGPAICVGAKASDHPAKAIKGALSESLQLLQHMVGTRVARAGSEAPEVITGDDDRLAFIASDRGVDALQDWFANPVPAAPPVAAVEMTSDELLRRSMLDGLDPLVLDLTARLPQAARDMGWSVLKVVPSGYQPLRVDERCTFGWNQTRLRDAPRRTGVAARLDIDERSWAPHPLP